MKDQTRNIITVIIISILVCAMWMCISVLTTFNFVVIMALSLIFAVCVVNSPK
jgi:hypothetical protein